MNQEMGNIQSTQLAPNRMTTFELCDSTVDGIHYWTRRDAAQGKPWLVFVHGVGLDHTIWVTWMDQLHQCGEYNYLGIDVPGYGKSTSTGKPRTLTLWVSAVLEVMSEVGARPATLIGESLGGTTVLALAAQHSSVVQALVLISTGFRGSLIRELVGWSSIIATEGLPGWSEYMCNARFHPQEDQHIRKQVYNLQCVPDQRTIVDDGKMLMEVDLTNELPLVKAPVLLLQPGASPFISRTHVFELESRLPRCELILFGTMRHGLVLSRSSILASITNDFIVRNR